MSINTFVYPYPINVRLKKESQGAYFAAISEAFGREYMFIQTALKRLIEPNKIGVQTDLFMIDTG